MTETSDAVAQYRAMNEQFLKRAEASAPAWLTRLRSEAIERFSDLGFPTRKLEAWRHTNLAPLGKIKFSLQEDFVRDSTPDKPIRDMSSWSLVLGAGRLREDLTGTNGLPPGVRMGSLARAIKDDPDLVESHLARYANDASHPFLALNTAFLEDGAFIYIPRGTVLEKPIRLFHVSSGDEDRPIVSFPRVLVVAEEASQLTLIEIYSGGGNDTYFTNAVTEIYAGENSVIEHVKLQTESTEAFHIATQQIHQCRGSNVSTRLVSIGAKLARSDIGALLAGEGCESTLDGLYLADGDQHVDNHTCLDHAMPHCSSHELYKGILSGKSSGVFSGKIIVRPDAQKTDAKQSNKNLLLSDSASIETQPQLEILANDVRCTHGATVGQLDADAIFYLRSRGLDGASARALLTCAFANEIIDRIGFEPLRRELEELIFERFQNSSSNSRERKETS